MSDETEATMTLGQELQRAFDEAAKEDVAEEVVEDEVPEEVDTTEYAEDDEVGVDDDEQVEKTEDDFPLIPNDMSDDEKQAFRDLMESDDPDKQVAAEILLARYNNLKKGFYAKSKQFAEDTKELQEVKEVFAPFQEAMQQNGVSASQYMQNMVMWEQSLQSNPVETVKQIMKRFNVTPDKLGVASEDLDFDEEYDIDETSSLKKEVEELKKQVSNQPVQAKLEEFQHATDPQTGELKHPQFQEVAPLMGTLIQTGKARTLEQAYAKAIRVVEESSDPEPVAVDVEKIRQKVGRAKRASKAVKSRGSRPDFGKMSIREELAARLNQQ